MTDVMSYAADRTEDAEQAAPTESATQNADAQPSAAEVIASSNEPTAEPAAPVTVDPTDSETVDGPVAGDPTDAAAQSESGAQDVGPIPVVDPWPVDLRADVVEVARAAAAAEAGAADRIGEHVDSIAEDQVARTVRFVALDAGYRGWQWSVTLALLPDEPPTVSEVVLLPGPDALVAPVWLPWDQRVRPGDLGPTDLLPAAADDPRLVPGYVESDDPAIEALAAEVGLGRERVLSREGRDDAADRWHDGPFGPASPTAKAAPALCGSCGFYAPLAGSLGGAFGVCANELSPADARVVDVAFGCGAHSEVPAPPPAVPVGVTVLDEVTLEVHGRPQPGIRDAERPAAELPDDDRPTDEIDADHPAAALTDAAETAPTLDVVEAADLATIDPAAPPAPAEPAPDGTVEEGTDADVAVEPEPATVAGAVSGPDAEIVVAAEEVAAEEVAAGDVAAGDAAVDDLASDDDTDTAPAAESGEPTTDGEPTAG